MLLLDLPLSKTSLWPHWQEESDQATPPKVAAKGQRLRMHVLARHARALASQRSQPSKVRVKNRSEPQKNWLRHDEDIEPLHEVQ